MIKLAAYFTRFGSKSDGSASLGFSTQELSSEDFAQFKDDLNQFGLLMFRPNEMQAEDIPTEDVEDKDKTPSKRLRATLFVLYAQSATEIPFEQFYRERMEKIISMIKDKLE